MSSAKNTINKVLIVSKTTRLQRLLKKGITFTPKIAEINKKDWEQSHSIHHKVVETFAKYLDKAGMEGTVKLESDLQEEDIDDKDLVITLGGDSSYLRAAGLIHSRNIPILGINSDPTRRTGALLNAEIDFKNQDIQIPRLLEDICAQNFEYFYRTRALFEIENHMNGTVTQKLCLNEVFAAEKDVSCTSMYKLLVDGKDMGKFKSSGIIISTGTGSSGWLYSARQITPQNVSIIQKFLGAENDNDLVNENISSIISKQHVFPHDCDQLYYFVREGYVCDARLYAWRAEGYCKKVKVISEMINGTLQIDGYFKQDLGIGDNFTVSYQPDNALKCIKLPLKQ